MQRLLLVGSVLIRALSVDIQAALGRGVRSKGVLHEHTYAMVPDFCLGLSPATHMHLLTSSWGMKGQAVT